MCKEDSVSILTREMIEEDLNTYFKPAKVALLLNLLLVVIFTIISVWISYFWMVTVFFLLCFILIVAKTKGCDKKKNYYIVMDKCIKKRKEDYGEEPIYYNIFLKNHGKHLLNNYSGHRMSSPKDFESILVGDSFYLVVINKHKKRSFIYSAKKWDLDTNSFIEKNGKYYPN